MPLQDQITLQLTDLDNIVQAIIEKKPAGGIIRIIDNGAYLTLRDKDSFLISSIKKTPHEES